LNRRDGFTAAGARDCSRPSPAPCVPRSTCTASSRPATARARHTRSDRQPACPGSTRARCPQPPHVAHKGTRWRTTSPTSIAPFHGFGIRTFSEQPNWESRGSSLTFPPECSYNVPNVDGARSIGSMLDIVDQKSPTALPRKCGTNLPYAKYDRVEFRVLVVDPSRSLRGDPSGPKCRGDRQIARRRLVAQDGRPAGRGRTAISAWHGVHRSMRRGERRSPIVPTPRSWVLA
jgi:hypothetical protein